MVWVLERCREDIPTFSSHKSCKWEVIDNSSHFSVQKRIFKITQGKESNSSSTCKFCKDLQVLGGGQCLLCGERSFRIVFESPIRLVVAKSNHQEEIQEHMKQLIENIQPMLTILAQDHSNPLDSSKKKPKKKSFRILRAVTSTTQEITTQPTESVQKEMADFVKLKVASMIKNEEHFQENFKKLLKEETFKKYFPTVGIEEKTMLCKFFRSKFKYSLKLKINYVFCSRRM